MNRADVLKILISAMQDEDIGIFTGAGLCTEASLCRRNGNVYINNYDNVISIAIGIASSSARRVFVFCDDFYFLRNISESVQASVSRCKNIYLVILNSNTYNDVGNHPTIYKSMSAPRNLLFDMGYSVHDYKRQISNMADSSSEIRSIWDKVNGPLAVVIEVKCNDFTEMDTDFAEQKTSIEELLNFMKI